MLRQGIIALLALGLFAHGHAGAQETPPPPAASFNSDLPPVSPAAPSKTVLALTAGFGEKLPLIERGVKWRVFSDQSDLFGNYALVAESDDAKLFLTLDPGGYIVHVTYGLTSTTRHIILGNTALAERINLEVGALRLTGMVGDVEISQNELEFEVSRLEENGEQIVADNIQPQQIVRLEAGTYQITSIYGKANARVVSEVVVQPGKLIEATVHHKAGRVNLKLGEDAPTGDIVWSILTPGGDTVSEDTLGSSVVLAAGDYTALARVDGKNFQKDFSIVAGEEQDIIVDAQTPSRGGEE